MSEPQYFNIWHKEHNRWTNASLRFGEEWIDYQVGSNPFPLTLDEATKWFEHGGFSYSKTFEVRRIPFADITSHMLKLRHDLDKAEASRQDQQRRKEHADKYL